MLFCYKMLEDKYPSCMKLLTSFFKLKRIEKPIDVLNLYSFFDHFGYKIVPEVFMLTSVHSLFLPTIKYVTKDLVITYRLYKENNKEVWLKIINEKEVEQGNIQNVPLDYETSIKLSFLFSFELMEKIIKGENNER